MPLKKDLKFDKVASKPCQFKQHLNPSTVMQDESFLNLSPQLLLDNHTNDTVA